MTDSVHILALMVIMTGGVVAHLVARQLRFSLPASYLLAGLLLSLVVPTDLLQSGHINSLVVVAASLLLFVMATKLSWQGILDLGVSGVVGGLLQMILVLVLASVTLGLFGFDQFDAFVLGSLFAISSPSLIDFVLHSRNERGTAYGKQLIGLSGLQQLVGIVFFALIASAAGGNGAIDDLAVAGVQVAVLIALSYVGSKYLIPLLTKQLVRTANGENSVILSIFIGAAFLFAATYLGVPVVLAAFAAGLLLADSLEKEDLSASLSKVSGVLLLVVFTGVASLVSVTMLTDEILLIVFSLAVLLGVKTVVAIVVSIWTGMQIGQALKLGLLAFQTGELGIVIMQLGVAAGWVDGRLMGVIIIVVTFSMLLTPLLFANVNYFYGLVEAKLKQVSPNLYRHLFLSQRGQ